MSQVKCVWQVYDTLKWIYLYPFFWLVLWYFFFEVRIQMTNELPLQDVQQFGQSIRGWYWLWFLWSTIQFGNVKHPQSSTHVKIRSHFFVLFACKLCLVPSNDSSTTERDRNEWFLVCHCVKKKSIICQNHQLLIYFFIEPPLIGDRNGQNYKIN